MLNRHKRKKVTDRSGGLHQTKLDNFFKPTTSILQDNETLNESSGQIIDPQLHDTSINSLNVISSKSDCGAELAPLVINKEAPNGFSIHTVLLNQDQEEIQLEKLSIGDMILTPTGPKPVTNVSNQTTINGKQMINLFPKRSNSAEANIIPVLQLGSHQKLKIISNNYNLLYSYCLNMDQQDKMGSTTIRACYRSKSFKTGKTKKELKTFCSKACDDLKRNVLLKLENELERISKDIEKDCNNISEKLSKLIKEKLIHQDENHNLSILEYPKGVNINFTYEWVCKDETLKKKLIKAIGDRVYSLDPSGISPKEEKALIFHSGSFLLKTFNKFFKTEGKNYDAITIEKFHKDFLPISIVDHPNSKACEDIELAANCPDVSTSINTPSGDEAIDIESMSGELYYINTPDLGNFNDQTEAWEIPNQDMEFAKNYKGYENQLFPHGDLDEYYLLMYLTKSITQYQSQSPTHLLAYLPSQDCEEDNMELRLHLVQIINKINQKKHNIINQNSYGINFFQRKVDHRKNGSRACFYIYLKNGSTFCEITYHLTKVNVLHPLTMFFDIANMNEKADHDVNGDIMAQEFKKIYGEYLVDEQHILTAIAGYIDSVHSSGKNTNKSYKNVFSSRNYNIIHLLELLIMALNNKAPHLHIQASQICCSTKKNSVSKPEDMYIIFVFGRDVKETLSKYMKSKKRRDWIISEPETFNSQKRKDTKAVLKKREVSKNAEEVIRSFELDGQESFEFYLIDKSEAGQYCLLLRT
ncbi:hypothetical protein BN7_5440 [Wickerhamomyces ciferrii]|uniref:Uncharacterized protein n=1 Tax=Wickerhamomyces ciferrii (strain ATCC 14091 / BCRC 22168 / CBS 111 / JCM 3599 / NBRC 0793 / NRRL Y-1031 F-60-10) TaxID=1206466 RepID=K0KWI3_WICCF|nr:uncharacterized protein BN7_5440 [Wickerhamomyces ciferrii]CCH45854.1 hypothetical protein BN7_5440 [Wickerhamomyces ciferrii]